MPHEWEFLSYNLRWLRSLELPMVGSDECSEPIVFSPPEDKQVIIYEWDLAQFVRLFTSVYKGAQLAYPDDWIQVTWDFLQGVDCPMDLCAIIQACIGETLAELQAGLISANSGIADLQEFALRNEGGMKTRFAPASGQASCDQELVAGGTIAVVEFMVTTIVDLMQIAEASDAGDDLEEWRDLIAAIPVFETLPIDDAFQFVDAMYQNTQEDFEAAVTEIWKQEAAEIFYCAIIANDCKLDTPALASWFMGLRAAFPGNLAADIFTRFGEASTPSLANQANMFLNQVLNGRESETIFQFYGRVIRAYDIGTQTAVFGFAGCADCETTRLGAYPVPDTWLAVHNAGTYQGDWLILDGDKTLTIDILSVREITAVRVFWWTQHQPTTEWTADVDDGTPEPLIKTWSGWGIPNVAECVFATPITGEVIRLTFPGVPYVVIQWVEWDSCAII